MFALIVGKLSYISAVQLAQIRKKDKMSVLFQTKHLTKRYKDYDAVADVSISISKGKIYGLIGKNGAGKTTLLKLISGLIKPTSGTVVFSETVSSKNECRIGVLIEAPGLYPNMTGYENLKAKSLCLGLNYSRQQIDELLDLVGLLYAKNKRAKAYSLGMKQRLGIALSLIGNPDLLLLDEPINGLDPEGIMEIRNIVTRLNTERNMTIIVSSHILDELAKNVTNFCIIHSGKMILEKSKDEFLKDCGELPIDEYYLKIIGGTK